MTEMLSIVGRNQKRIGPFVFLLLQLGIILLDQPYPSSLAKLNCSSQMGKFIGRFVIEIDRSRELPCDVWAD